MEWFYQPEPRLYLTPQKIEQIRQHLFGDAAAAMSGRLSDCELVQLLVVSSGLHVHVVDLGMHLTCGQLSVTCWWFCSAFCRTCNVRTAIGMPHNCRSLSVALQYAFWGLSAQADPSPTCAGSQWNDFRGDGETARIGELPGPCFIALWCPCRQQS
jgi:hypothetical protein